MSKVKCVYIKINFVTASHLGSRSMISCLNVNSSNKNIKYKDTFPSETNDIMIKGGINTHCIENRVGS